MSERLLVIDEGTSSARAMLFDTRGKSLGIAQHPVESRFPQPGWVEQDAEQIWQLTRAAAGSPPSASPTSARPSSFGTGAAAGRWRRRSSGRTAAPPPIAKP